MFWTILDILLGLASKKLGLVDNTRLLKKVLSIFIKIQKLQKEDHIQTPANLLLKIKF